MANSGRPSHNRIGSVDMPRRAGNLWPRVCQFDSMLAAAQRAARGKRDRASVARFWHHRESECLRLCDEIKREAYRPGTGIRFEIHDPKRRWITAAPFRDRVLHHALMAVLGPNLERSMIHESFACRKGKGVHRALDHAQALLRKHDFVLKMDIANFFGSIRHQSVDSLLRRRIKDRRILKLCQCILNGGYDAPLTGTGLPVGSLTSQWFANALLDPLDHWLKERIGAPGYVRYMDDFVVFADAKHDLRKVESKVGLFLGERLGLALNPSVTQLAPATDGLPFLGWRLYRGTRRLRPSNRRRSERKWKERGRAFRSGRISLEQYRQSVVSLAAHLSHGATYELRRSWLDREHMTAT